MIRSGAAEQPEPACPPFRILHPPLLCAFRTVALLLALTAEAWRLRLRPWWKLLAAELTLDLHPHTTKQIRKSKAKGNSARHPSPSRFF